MHRLIPYHQVRSIENIVLLLRSQNSAEKFDEEIINEQMEWRERIALCDSKTPLLCVKISFRRERFDVHVQQMDMREWVDLQSLTTQSFDGKVHKLKRS